jgi:glyoxylase-like metal-dependent hydrolase (beta-lactamase superfamily II)
MIISAIKGLGQVYTSNVYLISGDMRRVDDVNTLVDVGNDPTMLPTLAGLYAGVGKSAVEQIVLTHSHSDHTGQLAAIKERYGARVLAAAHAVQGVDQLLRDGELLQMGDRTFEVIHMPGHSQDSICLYNADDAVVFVGDAPVLVKSPGGTYEMGFVRALTRLCQKRVKAIYYGHGEPTLHDVQGLLAYSLDNVMKGQLSLKPSGGTDTAAVGR